MSSVRSHNLGLRLFALLLFNRLPNEGWLSKGYKILIGPSARQLRVKNDVFKKELRWLRQFGYLNRLEFDSRGWAFVGVGTLPWFDLWQQVGNGEVTMAPRIDEEGVGKGEVGDSVVASILEAIKEEECLSL